MEKETTILLYESIKKVLNEYAEVYAEVLKNNDWKNPFRELISKEIPALLVKCADIDIPYSIVGSYGKGRWTAVPWIAVFDSRITTSAQKGVYIVYLLNKDRKELYLTFEIAATEAMVTKTNAEGKVTFTGVVGNNNPMLKLKLRERAEQIRVVISDSYFSSDGQISSGAQGYDSGAVYYKKYCLDQLPSGEVLAEDLKKMIAIYGKYYEWISKTSNNKWWPDLSEYNPNISKEQWLALLENQDIIKPAWRTVLAMFYTKKEGITCSALGIKFNRNHDSISDMCTQMAKRIYTETKCPLINKEKKNQYWPILFLGRDADKTEAGSFAWKLRPELYEALTEFNVLRFLPEEEGEVPVSVSVKDAIDQIKAYITAQGFNYPDGIIENFYLSLKSKPFVILAGTSGTGKTRLVKLFAEAIDAEYKLVPVRPDWSDSSDLFGHVDLNGRFVSGEILDFIKSSQENPNKPYFLCLDEMNLARVEYYLSDFLSVIETRDLVNGKIISDPLVSLDKYGTDKDAADTYGEIRFPQNLYIVGTVNMDETTFPFSKKVLDRANTIEFNYVDLIPNFNQVEEVPEKLTLPNSFLRSQYLLLAQCFEEVEYVSGICSELQKMNVILRKADAHVGYRVRDEIVFYMLNNKKADEVLTYNEALDNEIMQKILPRIQGSSSSVRDMLCEMFKICAADHNQCSGDSDAEKMHKVLNDVSVNCKYRKSAEKLEMMVKRFEEDGFTSYWL